MQSQKSIEFITLFWTLKILSICILFFGSLPSTAQNKKANMDELLEFGELVNYEILPEKQNVQLLLIRNKERFENLLKHFGARPYKLKESNQVKSRQFKRAFPLYDFARETTLYLLNNGYIAVDQSKNKKSNPYYVCRTIDEYDFITQYLVIYRIDEVSKPIIQCSIHEHFLIKKFLESSQLQFITNKSDEQNKLFLTEDGRCVYVRYCDTRFIDSPTKRANPLLSDPQYKDETEFYYNMVIYESLTIMDLLDIFSMDDQNIDEENFRNHKKRLCLSEDSFVDVEVLNRSFISPVVLDKFERLSNVNGNDLEYLFLDNGTVLLNWPDNTFLHFKNRLDFDKYTKKEKSQIKMITNEVPDFNNLNQETNDYLKSKKSPAKILKLLNLNLEQNNLKFTLRQLDKKLNEYLFDNYFIELYFAEIVSIVGEVMIKKGNAQWVYSQNIGRYILKVDDHEVDFIPILYRELHRQRYTGFSSIEAIIEGLLIGSKLFKG